MNDKRKNRELYIELLSWTLIILLVLYVIAMCSCNNSLNIPEHKKCKVVVNRCPDTLYFQCVRCGWENELQAIE